MLANGWPAYTAVFACRKVEDAPWVYQPLTVFDPGGLLYAAIGIGVAPRELNAVIGGGTVVKAIPAPPEPAKTSKREPQRPVVEEEPPPEDYIRGKAVIFFTSSSLNSGLMAAMVSKSRPMTQTSFLAEGL